MPLRDRDLFFSAAQVFRLKHLTAHWRAARDEGPPLSDSESTELDQLIGLETLAAVERGAAVSFPCVGADVRRL